MRAPSLSLTLLQIAALSLASSAAIAATVYRWVDENGVVHFSDQPHPKAQEAKLPPPQIVSAEPPPALDPPSGGESSDAASSRSGYSVCTLTRPEPDEVFFNTRTVTGQLRLEPKLMPGHQVVVVMDGKRLEKVGAPNNLVLTDVDRGTHSVQVVVENGAGQAVCTTPSVTFHVRQPSVQAPNPQNRPKF